MKPDYHAKIKTLEELARAIGPRPRAKTVIMCHGMFDIVHPGHLRHLMYAKEKADLLIASLTADAHATKADFRPYVPQDLRAANLAALELHTPQATADDPWHPTAMVFDLDPGAPAGVVDCARVALELRDVLDQLSLRCTVKTSGSKGLHLSVPLRPVADAETTKAFALALGRVLEDRDPDLVAPRADRGLDRDPQVGGRLARDGLRRRLEPRAERRPEPLRGQRSARSPGVFGEERLTTM